MSRELGALACGMMVVGVTLTTAGVARAGSADAELPRWMAGCWRASRGAETVTERWIAADAGTLIGTSHTVKGDAVTGFEFLRVVLRQGVAVYLAQPGGAPPTEFAATTQTAASVTFENPAHDFPKRIGYQRVDAAHLTAWIDGGAGAKARRLEFAMTRVPCEP